MTTSDVFAVLALVVAVISFVVTIYEQYLKRATLHVVPGNDMYVSYGEDFQDLG